jgi:glycosyltransferase involved in cell wall biosynthesis
MTEPEMPDSPGPLAGKTICIITSIHPDYDGRVYKHCLSARRMGCRTVLISPWKPRDLGDGIEHRTFARSAGLGGRLKIYRDVWRLMKQTPADIYHFHDLDLLPTMVAWRFRSGRPVVYDVHENYPDEMRTRHWIPAALREPLSATVKYTELVGASLLRNIVIVVENQRRTVGKRWLNTAMVRNFAPRSMHEGAAMDHDRRPNAVIMTASAYVANGVLLFLDVAERVLQRRQDVTFYLADRFRSDTALRQRAIERLGRPPLAGHVQMLPNVLPLEIMAHVNKGTIGAAFDLRVPERVKALPMKLFEYMAGELPIVATDLPHSRQFIEDARCGLLGRPEDPQSLADAIFYLLEHPREAREMGRRGARAFLERFNWESQDALLADFYLRALRKNKKNTD